MRKKWLVAAFVASLVGIGISCVSLVEFFHIQKAGLEEASFCSINDVINCDIVNSSSYSSLFGIPLAMWGLLFYLVIAVLSLHVRVSKKDKKASLSFIFWTSVIGLVWTLRMAYVSAFILEAVCLTCMGQYVINIFLVIALYLSDTQTIVERFKLLFTGRVILPAVTAAAILGVGYLFALSAMGGTAEAPTSADIKALTAAHFRQSLYDIKSENIASAPVWGNKDAKVTIVEFSDFQCPFCRIAAFNIKPYLYEFRDKVKMVFINYPLDNSCNKYMEHPMHQNACVAAKAAVCANEKGKFWEYHDDIFKNHNKLSRDLLLNLAAKNGIDKEWMSGCIDSPGTKAKVEADIELAHHIYLNGTPSVFINQKALRYWRSPEIMRAIVRAEIERSK